MSSDRFWKSGAEAQLVQAVVHDYPRWQDEGDWHYVERVCILSGLLRSEDRAIVRADETLADLKRGGGMLAGEVDGG